VTAARTLDAEERAGLLRLIDAEQERRDLAERRGVWDAAGRATTGESVCRRAPDWLLEHLAAEAERFEQERRRH
jgi:hypothetical protein